MQVKVTVDNCNVRSGPSTGTSIIDHYRIGTVHSADQSAVPDWWALTEIEGYLSHTVAQLYIPPKPLPPGVIPYYSQEDLDAKQYPDDCGEACVKMMLATKGIVTTTDSLTRKIGGKGDSTCQQLVGLFTLNGVNNAQVQVCDEGKLPPEGAICLISDAFFDRAYVLSKGFFGQHFVVFRYGDDHDIGWVIVNDPNFYGESREWGNHHRYPRDQWEKGFTQCDPPRQMVVLNRTGV